MLWVNNDPNRVSSLGSLMKYLDISNVQASYWKFLFDKPIIFNSPECLSYIMSSIPKGMDVRADDYTGDCNPCIIIANTISRRLQRFDLEKKSWIGMHALADETSMYSSCMVLVNKHLLTNICT